MQPSPSPPLPSSSSGPQATPPPAADIHIFGYGSLCWRPDFPYLTSHPAYIVGYHRRFYQGSPDHRGTEQSPGRVVTLIQQREGRVHGMVYLVHSEQVKAVLDYLDVREQGGYECAHVTAHLHSPGPGMPQSVAALTYLATESNQHYLGPASDDAIAETIASSIGPSGRNSEYLFRLADWMSEMGVRDEHVEKLCEQVRRIQSKDAGKREMEKHGNGNAVRCVESERKEATTAADAACL